MKISDLFKNDSDSARSPLGSDYGVVVKRQASGNNCKFTAMQGDDGEVVGTASVDDCVISELETKEEKDVRNSNVLSQLLRDICDYADEYNKSIAIDLDSLDKDRKNFIHQFGFISNPKGYMERKPGSSFPLSVLERAE